MAVTCHRDPSLRGVYSCRVWKPGKAAGQCLGQAGIFSAPLCCSAALVPWEVVSESSWLVGEPSALLVIL